MKILVSLTTWSKRINSCKPTLDSIINQTVKPDEIEINLSYEQFPHGMADMPEFLKSMSKKGLVTLYFKDKDQKVYDKFLPTWKRHKGEDFIDITVDDDCIYEPEYIEQVVKNMEGNDFLASQDDVATAGEWMCYRSTVTDKMIPFLTDQLIEETPLDDHTILYLLHKVNAKRGKKIEAKVIDQNLGYGFRRYWNPEIPESECTKTACGYPQREFVKERNILHRYGIV